MGKNKEWHTQSIKHKIATVLILDGVNFRYSKEDGIVFSASADYVERLIYRLETCYGASVKPIIKEYK